MPTDSRHLNTIMTTLAHRLKSKIGSIEEHCRNLGRSVDSTFAPPLSIEVVRKFESQISIELPDDYVEFVTTFANGGLGPGLGLMSLQESVQCLAEIDEVCMPQNERTEIGRAFPLGPIDQVRATILELPLYARFPVNGILPICRWESPVGYSVMILSGTNRGKIAHVSTAYDGFGNWTFVAESDRSEFLGWYEHWLSLWMPPPVQAEWNSELQVSRLKRIKAGLGMGEKAIDRGSFIQLFKLFESDLDFLFGAINSILEKPLDTIELMRLLSDIEKDDVQMETYLMYDGELGEIFARPDFMGAELLIDIYGLPSEPSNTRSRETMPEKVIDLVTAFGSAFLFNREEGIDSEFLFRAKTNRIVDWKKIDQLRT